MSGINQNPVNPLAINLPGPSSQISDDKGNITLPWWYALNFLLTRTGGIVGIDITVVQAQAVAANTAATNASAAALAAQISANTGIAAASSAQTSATTANATASSAQATANAAQISANNAMTEIATETSRAEAAEALLAPLNMPVFTGPVGVNPGGATWTSGTGAPGSSQPVGSLYSRTGGGVGSTLYVSRGSGTWLAVAGV